MRVDMVFAKQLAERLATRPGPRHPGQPDPRFTTLGFMRVGRSLVARLLEYMPGAHIEYTVTNQGSPESIFEHAMYLHLRSGLGTPHLLVDRFEANQMVSRLLPAPDLEAYVPPQIDDQHRVLYAVHEVHADWRGVVLYEADTRRGAVARGRRVGA